MSPRPLSRRDVLSATVALAATGLLAGCGAGPSTGGPPPASSSAASDPVTDDLVRVGSADFPENRLLAEIYATAIQARGVGVERLFSVGTRELYIPALQDGSIDLVPEYTGNLLRQFDPHTTATAPGDIDQQLPRALPGWLRVLSPAAATDKDSVVVTTAYAAAHNLRSVADLAPLCSSIAFGAAQEFQTRADGLPGLAQTYDCKFKEFHPLDAGGPATVAALQGGSIQAADLFSTDASIKTDQFTVLDDPKSNFAAQNVVPLITTAKAGDPRVTGVLNEISAKLDTPTLTNLNTLVAGHADPAQVALDWLRQVGIIH